MVSRFLITFSVLLAGCAGSESKRATEQAAPPPPAAGSSAAAASDRTAVSSRPLDANGVILDCSVRSGADFGGAFHDSRNLVVGPLLLVGAGEPTPEAVVLAYDGQKFPLLVRAGHTVTIAVPREVRNTAGLAYGPFPEGPVHVSQAHDTITFVACDRDEPSGSKAGGPVTFWSGFVMTSVPTCLPLDVYVDDEPRPRRVEIALGAGACGRPSAEPASS